MRVLAVLLAYACAALVAPLLLIVQGAVTEGLSGGFAFTETVMFYGLFGAIAAIYALPAAAPVIIFTELRKRGDWKIFAFVGVVLGGILTLLFTELPLSWSNLGYSAVLLPIAFTCVMTYWTVAWKWFPPKAKTVSSLG